MKVSLIVPSIRPNNWLSIAADMRIACQHYEYEIIFVGPYLPPTELVSNPKTRYIKDMGSPSRCLQIGAVSAAVSTYANVKKPKEYVAWCSDDCQILPNAFDAAIEKADKEFGENDGMNLLYSEGANFTGNQHEDPSYWIARTHGDLKLPGVEEGWKIAPIFMYEYMTFMLYGGLDCSYEHVNMNTHDLAFCIQANGGKIIDSPSRVFAFDWQPQKSDYAPILSSFIENDRPRFTKQYQNKQAAKERFMSFVNWKHQPAVWKRRFNG